MSYNRQQKRHEARRKKNASGRFVIIEDSTKLKLFYDELNSYLRALTEPLIPLVTEYCARGTGLFMNIGYEGGTTIKQCDCIKMFQKDRYNISILPHNNGIEIYRLEVYQTGCGIGSYLMNIFNAVSLKLDIQMYLLVGTPGSGATYRDDLDDAKKRRFYHRHGFKRMAKGNYWMNSELNEISKPDIRHGKIAIGKQNEIKVSYENAIIGDNENEIALMELNN